jgi:DNA-directed RNA polymerase subunit RPC12/RpoP
MTFSHDPLSLSVNNDPRIMTHQNGKETLTDTSLNNNTIVDEFSILDEEEKKKYNTCSICFDDFKDESIIRKIKCSHIFHKDCIDPWLLNQSYKCPVCRDNVLPMKDPEI